MSKAGKRVFLPGRGGGVSVPCSGNTSCPHCWTRLACYLEDLCFLHLIPARVTPRPGKITANSYSGTTSIHAHVSLLNKARLRGSCSCWHVLGTQDLACLATKLIVHQQLRRLSVAPPAMVSGPLLLRRSKSCIMWLGHQR